MPHTTTTPYRTRRATASSEIINKLHRLASIAWRQSRERDRAKERNNRFLLLLKWEKEARFRFPISPSLSFSFFSFSSSSNLLFALSSRALSQDGVCGKNNVFCFVVGSFHSIWLRLQVLCLAVVFPFFDVFFPPLPIIILTHRLNRSRKRIVPHFFA